MSDREQCPKCGGELHHYADAAASHCEQCHCNWDDEHTPASKKANAFIEKQSATIKAQNASLARVRAERDEAIGRAAKAEAACAEMTAQLRLEMARQNNHWLCLKCKTITRSCTLIHTCDCGNKATSGYWTSATPEQWLVQNTQEFSHRIPANPGQEFLDRMKKLEAFAQKISAFAGDKIPVQHTAEFKAAARKLLETPAAQPEVQK